MTIYSMSGPDPLWVLLFVAAIGALIVGKWGRSRIGASLSRWLFTAGAVLLVGLIAYSLLRTWFGGPSQ